MFMARRAIFSPGLWKQNLALIIGLGAAFVMLGCGGGGGGGGAIIPPPTGDCGSAAGAGTVVCGYVVDFGTTTGANGATVLLKSAGGQTLASTTTITNPANNTPGFFKFTTIPAGAATIQIDAPATGYNQNFVSFGGKTYYYALTASAGGPCIPALVITNAGADNKLTNFTLFPSGSPPPPPVGCPR
jgi:hypothetical protein